MLSAALIQNLGLCKGTGRTALSNEGDIMMVTVGNFLSPPLPRQRRKPSGVLELWRFMPASLQQWRGRCSAAGFFAPIPLLCIADEG